MIKVSVIVPVYNAEKYLEKCISSIANQTMKDLEILVINDGSTDNSLKELEKLSLRYKGKLKLFDKENGGAGSARNIGIENASGEFIKFVDADDYLQLNILDQMYNVAKEHNVKLVRGNNQTIIGAIKTTDKCSWSDIKGSQIIDVRKNKDYIVTESPSVGNKLISRDLIGDLRFPEGTKWEDLAIMPIVLASSEKLFHMDQAVYNYRVNMNTTIKDFIKEIPNILDIIRCLESVKKQMSLRGLKEEYSTQIESIYILHTLFRVENAMMWVNFPANKKKVVISSLLGILDAKYPNWQENEVTRQYGEKNSLFKFQMSRLNKYIVDEYRKVDIITAEDNIERSFNKK